MADLVQYDPAPAPTKAEFDALNSKFGQVFYSERIHCTPTADLSAGQYGYFAVPITYAKNKSIISTGIGLGHPGAAAGYSLMGVYAGGADVIYVSYYTPRAISTSNADFELFITYTDNALTVNTRNESVVSN